MLGGGGGGTLDAFAYPWEENAFAKEIRARVISGASEREDKKKKKKKKKNTVKGKEVGPWLDKREEKGSKKNR